MAKKEIDPTFKKRFSINTPIRYAWDVEVSPSIQEEFARDWKKFYPRAKPLVSKTRKKSLMAAMKKIYREGSDESYSNRICIKYIGKKVGYGVFALCDIPPYSVLDHYAGVLKLDKSIKKNNDSAFNFTNFKKYSIDGAVAGNWTRFMNHCDVGNPGNNVVPWELYLPNGPRIVFTSGSCGILKGEQLLYSYGDDYWDDVGSEALSL